MKVLDARIEWMKEYSNHPRLQVLLDKAYKWEEIVLTQKGSLLWGERDGFVRFLYYDGPGKGFNGDAFILMIESPSGKIEPKRIIGPWSSNSNAMNRHFPHSLEVSYTTDPKVFERGYTFYGDAALTIELAREACQMAGAFLVDTGRHESAVWSAQSNADQLYSATSDIPDYVISLHPNRLIKPAKVYNKEEYYYKDMLTNERFADFPTM